MINSHVNRQWQEQIVSQPAVKFSMGIIGNNCKAGTVEDLNEIFLQKDHPKPEKQYGCSETLFEKQTNG